MNWNPTKMYPDQKNIPTFPLAPLGYQKFIFNLQLFAAQQTKPKIEIKNLACKFNSITISIENWRALFKVFSPAAREGKYVSDNPLDVAELYAWLINVSHPSAEPLNIPWQRTTWRYSIFDIRNISHGRHTKKTKKRWDAMRTKPICAHWGAKFMALTIRIRAAVRRKGGVA